MLGLSDRIQMILILIHVEKNAEVKFLRTI